MKLSMNPVKKALNVIPAYAGMTLFRVDSSLKIVYRGESIINS